jgi:hypothetical protein
VNAGQYSPSFGCVQRLTAATGPDRWLCYVPGATRHRMLTSPFIALVGAGVRFVTVAGALGLLVVVGFLAVARPSVLAVLDAPDDAVPAVTEELP